MKNETFVVPSVCIPMVLNAEFAYRLMRVTFVPSMLRLAIRPC